jgi:hypothetical protein
MHNWKEYNQKGLKRLTTSGPSCLPSVAVVGLLLDKILFLLILSVFSSSFFFNNFGGKCASFLLLSLHMASWSAYCWKVLIWSALYPSFILFPQFKWNNNTKRKIDVANTLKIGEFFVFNVYINFRDIGWLHRTVNDTLLAVYLICIIPDKTNMGKILFSLGHRIWIWIRKKFR